MDWDLSAPKPDCNCNHPSFYFHCLEAFSDCLLEQMVTSPTRGQTSWTCFSLLILLLSIKLVISCLSDHGIVLAEVNSRPELIKQVPRDIPLYKKADWDLLKQSMTDFYAELQSDPATTDSQALWDKFAARLQQGID